MINNINIFAIRESLFQKVKKKNPGKCSESRVQL